MTFAWRCREVWRKGSFTLGILLPAWAQVKGATFKICTVVQWVRGDGTVPVPRSADDLTPEQCENMVRILRSQFGAAVKTPQVVGILRNVLDRAKVQPPSAVASVRLLAAYGGAFFAAFIGGMLLYAPRN